MESYVPVVAGIIPNIFLSIIILSITAIMACIGVTIGFISIFIEEVLLAYGRKYTERAKEWWLAHYPQAIRWRHGVLRLPVPSDHVRDRDSDV